MTNLTNGDSKNIELRVIECFLKNEKELEAYYSKKAVLDMAKRDKLKEGTIPYISLKVSEVAKEEKAR